MKLISATFLFLTFAVLAAVSEASFECPSWASDPQFNCDIPAKTEGDKTVTTLTPHDFSAIMSVGDSITAGFAMQDLPVEYRGLVYSTGGTDGAKTIGNWLRLYNPNITGHCYKNTVPLDPYGCGLSGAVSGAVVSDIPSQVDTIVKNMENTAKHPEFAGLMDEWKLLTFFIGANDACACTSDSHSPENYETNLRTALQTVQDKLPNTFVSVVTLFNISQVWDEAANFSTRCLDEIQILKECHCLNKNETQRTIMDEHSVAFNQISEKVVAEFAAENTGSTTFTAVVQPGIQDMYFANWGEEFLSDLDCFHPSTCTDGGMAYALWNNMFTPPGKKATSFDPHNTLSFVCPGEGDVVQ